MTWQKWWMIPNLFEIDNDAVPTNGKSSTFLFTAPQAFGISTAPLDTSTPACLAASILSSVSCSEEACPGVLVPYWVPYESSARESAARKSAARESARASVASFPFLPSVRDKATLTAGDKATLTVGVKTTSMLGVKVAWKIVI